MTRLPFLTLVLFADFLTLILASRLAGLKICTCAEDVPPTVAPVGVLPVTSTTLVVVRVKVDTQV